MQKLKFPVKFGFSENIRKTQIRMKLKPWKSEAAYSKTFIDIEFTEKQKNNCPWISR